MAESKLMATVVGGAVLRTRVARARPYPTKLFYPGLSGRPLWSKYMEKHHSISQTLTENYDTIRTEYENLKKTTGQSQSDYEFDEHSKLHKGRWDWKSYMQKGELNGGFAATCPKTVEILESLQHSPVDIADSGEETRSEKCPSLFKGSPFGYAFFSTMGQQSAIDAHYGPTNLRVRCHFPLIVPPSGDVGMEIGGETVRWREGKPLFFDDCFRHRVWNNTDSERVVLLFDIWHPELEREEIEAFKDMFTYMKLQQQQQQQQMQ
jgi:aspartate beta-hydroxylase